MFEQINIFNVLSLFASAASLIGPVLSALVTLRVVEYRLTRAEGEITELKAIHTEISKVNDRLARIETRLTVNQESNDRLRSHS
jgi:hypothetical protein